MSAPFRPRAIIEELHAHGVRYVLIGGLAGVLHGSPATTNDADLCPADDIANLDRLATALRALAARIRTAEAVDGLAFDCTGAFFAGMEMVNLTTSAGDVDVAFRPAGTGGYDDLVRRAVEFEIDGTSIAVASLDDIIRSKTAADRPQDRATLPLLLALRDEIEEGR